MKLHRYRFFKKLIAALLLQLRFCESVRREVGGANLLDPYRPYLVCYETEKKYQNEACISSKENATNWRTPSVKSTKYGFGFYYPKPRNKSCKHTLPEHIERSSNYCASTVKSEVASSGKFGRHDFRETFPGKIIIPAEAVAVLQNMRALVEKVEIGGIMDFSDGLFTIEMGSEGALNSQEGAARYSWHTHPGNNDRLYSPPSENDLSETLTHQSESGLRQDNIVIAREGNYVYRASPRMIYCCNKELKYRDRRISVPFLFLCPKRFKCFPGQDSVFYAVHSIRKLLGARRSIDCEHPWFMPQCTITDFIKAMESMGFDVATTSSGQPISIVIDDKVPENIQQAKRTAELLFKCLVRLYEDHSAVGALIEDLKKERNLENMYKKITGPASQRLGHLVNEAYRSRVLDPDYRSLKRYTLYASPGLEMGTAECEVNREYYLPRYEHISKTWVAHQNKVTTRHHITVLA